MNKAVDYRVFRSELVKCFSQTQLIKKRIWFHCGFYDFNFVFVLIEIKALKMVYCLSQTWTILKTSLQWGSYIFYWKFGPREKGKKTNSFVWWEGKSPIRKNETGVGSKKNNSIKTVLRFSLGRIGPMCRAGARHMRPHVLSALHILFIYQALYCCPRKKISLILLRVGGAKRTQTEV